MPANVTKAFERATVALFEPKQAAAADFRGPPKTVFEAWNRLAAKFHEVYPFATASKKARETEEKLTMVLKVDKAGLAVAFARRLEGDSSPSVEAALETWYKEVSR